MTIDYAYWQGALALGDQINHDRDHIAPTEPQAGFYRTWDNKGVAIWPDDDGLNFLVDGRQLHPNEFEDVWLRVCRKPVTEEQWRNYGDTGKWHDIDPVISETFGHNIEGAQDPETIAELLNRLKEAAAGYADIKNEEESKRAHGIRNRINQLKLRATKLHKEEKEPHLRAGQAVDRKWNPMVKEADAVAVGLGRSMGRWEDAKRIAIRRAEIEAEEARRKAAEANLPPPPPLASLPEPSAQIRSGFGKAASVKVKLVLADVTDWAALLRRYSQHQEVRQLLMNLAQKDIDAGLTIEGVLVEERSVVR